MNKLVLFITVFVFATNITAQVSQATAKMLYFNLSTQTGKKVELDRKAKNGQTIREFKFSSGRLGYETPASPPQGWVVGKKTKNYWSKKYQCWMPWAVNLGIKDREGNDFGAYSHQGRIPKGGYNASHGCIRLTPELAEEIFNWADEGRTRVFITGSGQDFIENHFEGRHLLEFNPNDRTIKGFKRNPNGSLTREFIEYASQGKIDIYTMDKHGNPVSLENGVLSFEFFENPWQQGISKAELERFQLDRVKTALKEAGLLK